MNRPGNERELIEANNYVTELQIATEKWHPITQLPAIFFAKVGAAVFLNRKRLVNRPFLLDNNTMAFVLDTTAIDYRFAMPLFERLDLRRLIQVGALPSYNSSDVEETVVKVPRDFDEQEAVGSLFSTFDSLITLHQRKELASMVNCLQIGGGPINPNRTAP